MSNDSLALPAIGAALTRQAEYDAVYAAVTATERGRWFLAEYASRNRQADTDALIGAIARLETVVRGDTGETKRTQAPDIGTVAERIADIAIELRERAADPALCDALEAAVRELCDSCKNGAIVHDVESTASLDTAPVVADRPEGGAADKNGGAPSDLVILELQDSEKFAEAAVAFAASLRGFTDQAEAACEPPGAGFDAVIPERDRETAARPRTAASADDASRRLIEAPDFVFHRAKPALNGRDGEAPGQSSGPHTLLPGPLLMPSPDDDAAALFEPAPERIGIPPDLISSPPAESPPAEAAQAATIPPPQLAIANGSTVRAMPRPVPVNALAGLRALSEDELVALFG